MLPELVRSTKKKLLLVRNSYAATKVSKGKYARVNRGPGLCSYEDDSSKNAVFSFKNVFAINPLSHLDLLNTGKRQIF